MHHFNGPEITNFLIGFFFAALMLGFGIPLAMRKIGPNGFVGVRLPVTMENPDIWYEVNAYCGRLMVQVGIVVGLLSLLVFVPGFDARWYMAMISASILISGIVITVKSMMFTRAVVSRSEVEIGPESPAMIRPGLIASAVTLVIEMGLAAYAWSRIPAGKLIVTHWGLHGPDGYADKTNALLVWPLGLLVGTTIFLGIITWAMGKVPGMGKKAYIVLLPWILVLVAQLVGQIVIITTALRH
jgi:hypothetical protein